MLATSAALAPLVERIGGVDLLLPTPTRPAAVPWTGAAPDVAVNLHGTGPQSHRALDALNPGRRIGFRCGEAGPGWEGPAWDAVAAAHPHERARWCALLEAVGIPADADDLRLPSPTLAGPTHRGRASRIDRRCVACAGPRPPRRGLRGEAVARRAVRGRGRRARRTADPGPRHRLRRRAATSPWPSPATPGLPVDRVLAGRTDLGALCDLVARAGLVISGDTGIAHLASAYGTPSVVLFGPVDPAQWGPPADGPHVALAQPGRSGAGNGSSTSRTRRCSRSASRRSWRRPPRSPGPTAAYRWHDPALRDGPQRIPSALAARVRRGRRHAPRRRADDQGRGSTTGAGPSAVAR